MTDASTINRRTSRRHRAKKGMGVYVTDLELIEYLGLPVDTGRQILHELDRNRRQSKFPQRQPFWGDRRYMPAVEKWLDATNGLIMDDPKRRAS